MKFAVDLHIHSALSPCSDDDMTPNNIVNMAMLKGLDIIAITDHNSFENYPAVLKCAQDKSILVVPGMEVETKEEVHVLCYFPGMKEGFEMQKFVYSALPFIKNREEIFGRQLIMDEKDTVKGSLEHLLLTAADVSMEEVIYKVRELGGAAVPAHIDRESYSVLSNLGMIPENLEARYLELSKGCAMEEFLKKSTGLKGFKFIKSSDAHHLGDMLERESFVDIEALKLKHLINLLR